MIFYLSQERLLTKLHGKKIWIGDSESQTLPGCEEILDFRDFLIADKNQQGAYSSSLSTPLLSFARSYFYTYADQLARWRLFENINIALIEEQFITDICVANNLIERKNISLLIFNEDPHRAFDFMFYVVAKFHGIPTLIFSETVLNYRSFIKSEIGQNLLESFPVKHSIREPAQRLKVDISHVKMPDSEASPSFKDLILKLRQLTIKAHDRYLKIKKVGFLAMLGNPNPYIHPRSSSKIASTIKTKLFFSKAWIARFVYRNYYKNVPKKQSANINAIVWYAHYWPERTSNPLAAPFLSNQLDCLKILKHSGLPIFYKEHPTALVQKNWHQNRTAQSINHISKILELGIKLANENIPKETFVATLNGTIGIEAAMEGRGVITFGNAWYDFLPNVHKYTSCTEMMHFILNFEKFDQDIILDELQIAMERHTLCVSAKNESVSKSELNKKRAALHLKDIVENVH